ncbi:MAG: GatB/YqeY domain-containing protein [Betaproteobacteria bacterium]|nr:GatB/YqeY domain-containing protein [Betaproteobacteria bacterium]
MSLKDRITEDMKAAMRARQTERLSAIRMLLAAIKQREVDDRVVADDALVSAIVDKLIKQRRDSLSQFEQAGREDLAQRERGEIETLSAYLPRQADAAEVEAAIAAAVAETGAAGPQDMGKVMGLLKPRLAGRADLSAVSAAVRARLAGH